MKRLKKTRQYTQKQEDIMKEGIISSPAPNKKDTFACQLN